MKIRRLGFLSGTSILGLIAVLLLANSCKHNGVPADQMRQISFAEIEPIFTSYCGKCHDGNGGENNSVFTDYTSIVKSITPGNASKSKAYQAMTSTVQIMPPDIAMPTNKRTLIRLWIEQGAKPN